LRVSHPCRRSHINCIAACCTENSEQHHERCAPDGRFLTRRLLSLPASSSEQITHTENHHSSLAFRHRRNRDLAEKRPQKWETPCRSDILEYNESPENTIQFAACAVWRIIIRSDRKAYSGPNMTSRPIFRIIKDTMPGYIPLRYIRDNPWWSLKTLLLSVTAEGTLADVGDQRVDAWWEDRNSPFARLDTSYGRFTSGPQLGRLGVS